jgi:pyruvate dehydrogenase E2 component (dihydrolipoamide acetyltransferase)
MAEEVKMPQLSDTMNAGKILSWYKKVGETIKRGDPLAEVETEKANLEIESFYSGVLLKIIVPENEEAKVGQPIAVIGEAGENVSSQPAPANPKVEQKTEKLDATFSVPVDKATNQGASQTTSSESSATRIKVSPLARKLAEQQNINLADVQGSGPGGRVVKKDLESKGSSITNVASTTSTNNSNNIHPATGQHHSDATAKAKSQIESLTPTTGGTLEAFSKMRGVIAQRMQQTVTESPHFYVTVSVDMDEAIKLKSVFKTKPGFEKITVNHLIIKACAYALEREPRINYAVREGKTYKPNGIHIGIVTALEDGLLIPVIQNTNTLSLQDLAFEVKAAVERARAGRPSAQDLSGGTFSISNMGMFDVENFTALINPGQGAILAVSSTKAVPVVKEDKVVVGNVMKVTLSVDHRIIDGIMVAQFLSFFKEALQMPALLFL